MEGERRRDKPGDVHLCEHLPLYACVHACLCGDTGQGIYVEMSLLAAAPDLLRLDTMMILAVATKAEAGSAAAIAHG